MKKKPNLLAPGLNPQSIKILSWNINKGNGLNWQRDWSSLSAEVDIALLQEAELGMALRGDENSFKYSAFSPGYKTKKINSGVLTLSSESPVTHCNLQHFEPWLKTPKAIAVTEFSITNTEQTLLVTNLHAINFSIGIGDFANQFADIGKILTEHTGPIVFAGDFNTWRRKRLTIVSNLISNLGLATVGFDPDHRRTLNGLAFSHFYTRGLTVQHSETWQVPSSDHNPMFVELKLDGKAE